MYAGYGPMDYPIEDRVVVMILIENDNSERLKYAANLANLIFYCYTDHKTFEEAAKRLLIGGNACVTIEAAKVFAENNIYLVGNESQTVGPLEGPAQVHYELLKAEIVLLEGIRLEGIKEGVYLLNAAPINLGGADGAPCRAILVGDMG